MTMLEKILKDRTWRGATVEEVPEGGPGRPAHYKLAHPCGATAIVLKEPGDMEARRWRTWAMKRTDERRATTGRGW